MLPSTVNSGLSSPATIPGCSTLQVRVGVGRARGRAGGETSGVWEKRMRGLKGALGYRIQERVWAGWKGERGARRLMESRAWKLPAPLPQEATPIASGLAEMRSSTSTGVARSPASSAVPVVWTGAVWTLLYTVTVMPTSPSGKGGRGTGLSGRQGQLSDRG